MITQRSLKQPEFYHDLYPSSLELVALCRQYKEEVIDSRVSLEKQKQAIDDTRAELDKTGLPHNFKIQCLEKDIERLHVQHRFVKELELNYIYRIEGYVSRIYTHFYHLQSEFRDKAITEGRYVYFLNFFKQSLEAGLPLNLRCFKNPPFQQIVKEIEEWLPKAKQHEQKN